MCAAHSSLWISCQRILRKVIWSWFAVLADMECITFLEFREENQLSNANQIYFPAVFVQTSIHDNGIPHGPRRMLSAAQYRVLFFPSERTAFYTDSLLFGAFILSFCFCHRDQCRIEAQRAQKPHWNSMFAQFQPKETSLHSWREKTLGLVGKEPLPLCLSHARKVWSAGAGICQALAVAGGCDVSHFRMDSTMCGTPPSFFLFFLSCQINACSLGYRTEGVIHQKWWKRMHDSDFFPCTPWFICLSFIWATDRGFGEQCKIWIVSTHHNRKQHHSTKMLRQTECSSIYCSASVLRPTFRFSKTITLAGGHLQCVWLRFFFCWCSVVNIIRTAEQEFLCRYSLIEKEKPESLLLTSPKLSKTD